MRLAAEADVVVAIGTRLQDFTTGSWSVFASPDFTPRSPSTRRASMHTSIARCALVADAREAITELDAALAAYRAPQRWSDKAKQALCGLESNGR